MCLDQKENRKFKILSKFVKIFSGIEVLNILNSVSSFVDTWFWKNAFWIVQQCKIFLLKFLT